MLKEQRLLQMTNLKEMTTTIEQPLFKTHAAKLPTIFPKRKKRINTWQIFCNDKFISEMTFQAN